MGFPGMLTGEVRIPSAGFDLKSLQQCGKLTTAVPDPFDDPSYVKQATGPSRASNAASSCFAMTRFS